jgi:translation initiation factor 2 beta subunit (eIF-2beta)/eIF-5
MSAERVCYGLIAILIIFVFLYLNWVAAIKNHRASLVIPTCRICGNQEQPLPKESVDYMHCACAKCGGLVDFIPANIGSA